jgi:thiamine biosynthesis lipoprotein
MGRMAVAFIGGALAVAAPPPTQVDRDAYLMGTRAHLAVWAAARAEGLTQLDKALLALEETEAELSTWREDSTISVLNRTPVGTVYQASASTCRLLGTLAGWHEESSGAFDPAIGALTAAWAIHEGGRVPAPGALAAARAASGFTHLEFDKLGCRMVRHANVAVDVGAFGKGEALDRAAAVLGDVAWMIDLGGQVSAGLPPPDRPGWDVAIAHPRDRSHPLLRVSLRQGSLATSAGSERDHHVDGQRIGHILDPRSGRPAPFDGSVTVWHPSGLVADILSTALFVMGPELGAKWAEDRGIAACYLIPPAVSDTCATPGRWRPRCPAPDLPAVVTTTAFRSSVIFSGGTLRLQPHEEN